jgi:DNA-binding response OmpR family regulator
MRRAAVLLVEDEALIALHTEEVLSEAGYAVVGPATTLDAALAHARAAPLAAAVLDVNLDGSAVWPVAALLRERGIGFVLLSGFSGPALVPAVHRGAPCLTKPFDEEALVAAVADIVNRSNP